MNIVIQRYHINQDSIDGVLKIDGTKVCDCAEHTPTALVAGTYTVSIHRCKHYRRKMPCIMVNEETSINHKPLTINQRCTRCEKLLTVSTNTTMPTYCPQIKIGNGVHNRTDGSIIIGERITWGCIKHPVEHFNRLIDRLDKAANRGDHITLTITEDYPPVRHPLTNFELCQILVGEQSRTIKHF